VFRTATGDCAKREGTKAVEKKLAGKEKIYNAVR